MKIAIMSDSHENWDNLDKAVNLSNTENCEYLLFAGDLISPNGMTILGKFKGSVKFVWGNNEGEVVGILKKVTDFVNISVCGNAFEDTIDGVKVFMNHYPRISELAAKSKEFDLCIHGHTHVYREEKIDNTLLINPGTLHDYNSQPTFVIFDTKTKEVTKINL